MTRLRRVVAAFVVMGTVAAVTGCGLGSEPEIDDVQAAMTDLSLQQVGSVSLHPNHLTLTYVEDGVWKYANWSQGRATVHDANPTQYGWKLVPVAELRLAELEQQLAAVQGGHKCVAEVGVTQAGARLSQIECGRDRVSTTIDGKEIAVITQWDEASIDQALGELVTLSGPTLTELRFTRPERSIRGDGPRLLAVGVELTIATGQRCSGEVTRDGASQGSPGELSPLTCELDTQGQDPGENPAATPIVLAEVSGAKIYQAWTRCAAHMGVPITQVPDVTVKVRHNSLTLQSPIGATTCLETVG